MRGVGESEEFHARAVTQTFVGHFGQEEGVALAPEDAVRDGNGCVWNLDASAEEPAVAVDHGGQGAGLRPCSAVLDEVFIREGAGAAGAEKGTRADAEVKSGENRFRQPGQLKEEHVPTAEKLARPCAEEFAHHRRMRDVEDNELGDALRMKQGSAPGDGCAPIMSSEKDFFLAELVGDGDDVGDEFCQGIRGNPRGLAAEVVAALVGDDDAKSSGGQRLDLSMPAIPGFREAGAEDCDPSVLRASSLGVEGTN